MDEQQFQDFLLEVFNSGEFEFPNSSWTELENCDICSFSDAHLLTNNKGLVIRLDDGSEFQITIVQSYRKR